MAGKWSKNPPRGAPKGPRTLTQGTRKGGRGTYASLVSSQAPTNQSASLEKPKAGGWKTARKEVETTRTFGAQDNLRYYQQKREGKNQFLGEPPQSLDICKARMVLPGEHKVPRGLDKPGALDHIRKSCQVWIVHVQLNILDVYAADVSDLRRAVTEINWAIHNFRLSNEHPNTRFIVQPPMEVDEDSARVIITLGSRPHVDHELASEEASDQPIVEDIIPKLWFDMNPVEVERSLETLRGLEKDLQMRVNFGLLKIREKKKSGGDSYTYRTLPTFLKPYPTRGTRGAKLETDMAGTEGAHRALEHLNDCLLHEAGFDPKCSAAFIIQEGPYIYEITSNILIPDNGRENLHFDTPVVTVPEQFPRMNWVFLAPDQLFDWNLQVDAWEPVQGRSSVIDKIELHGSQTDYEGVFWFPRLGLKKLDLLENDVKIKEIRLKSAFVTPHRNPSWLVEVGVTKTWKGASLSSHPEITWGVELYGNQWAGTINTTTDESKRKAWGQDFTDMWPGSGEHDFSSRFQEFLRTIVDVQGHLSEAVVPKA